MVTKCLQHGQAKKMSFLFAALQRLVFAQRGVHGVLGLFRILFIKPSAAVLPLFQRNVWALVDEAEQRQWRQRAPTPLISFNVRVAQLYHAFDASLR